MAPEAPPTDRQGLAELLSALGYPLRLELLEVLRAPKTLGEIRVAPKRALDAGTERPAARQTVQHHLDKLVETGLVRAELVERGGKEVPQYVVHAQRLYALAEDLRRIAVRQAVPELTGDPTHTAGAPPRPPAARGPRLVLVHGAYEGRAFPLADAASRDGRWLVGRKRGLAVSLDYDPYVSLENAAVHREGAQFVLTDLRSSKNGTSLNWAPLPRGGSHPLRTGDFVGVGCSLLCFLAE